MPEDIGRQLSLAALGFAGLLSAWTALKCRRAYQRGEASSDAPLWTVLAIVVLLLSSARLAIASGVFRGTGAVLRTFARENGLSTDRRTLQIAATIAVAFTAAAVFIYGVVHFKEHARRYRFILDSALVTLTAGIIALMALREMDALSPLVPWARTIVEVTSAAGISAMAIARLGQIRRQAGL